MKKQQSVPGLSIRFRISELRPTAQRLRELFSLFGRWGYRELYIDWGDSFPWSLDGRFRSNDAYREELVAGIYREISPAGANSVFPAPDELEFVSRLASYRHLFSRENSRPVLDLEKPAGRKFYADLVDDFLSLLPEPGTVLVNWREDKVPLTFVVTILRIFAEAGVSVSVCCDGCSSVTKATIDSLLENCVFVVVPEAVRHQLGTGWGERLLSGWLLADERERSRGEPVEREPSVMICAGPEESAVIAERAAAARSEYRDVEVGFLSDSIELSLAEVRMIGGSGQEGDDLQVRRAAEIASELASYLDEAWRLIRRIRESVAGDLDRSDTRSTAKALLERLQRIRIGTAGAAREFASLMKDRIDQDRFQRVAARNIAPLEEEYHALVGRVAAHSGGFEELE